MTGSSLALSTQRAGVMQTRSSTPLLLTTSVAVLLLLLAIITGPVYALEYGFSDESPTVCFVEEVPDLPRDADNKARHLVVGSYTWRPHTRNGATRLVLFFKDPDERVLTSELMRADPKGEPVPFAFKAEVGTAGRYFLCAALDRSSSVPADDPIFVSFDVDQQDAVPFADEEEEAVMALKEQYGRKRRRREQMEQAAQGGSVPATESPRETVGNMVTFVYRDFGGQLKTILQSPEYLAALGRDLNQLEITAKRKVSLMTEDLEKEERMRSTSESTFSRVWTCAMIVILATALVVTWQFSLLRTTLKRKKKL